MKNWEMVKEVMLDHMVEYYAYIKKYFPRILRNVFGSVKWRTDPTSIVYVTTVVLNRKSFREVENSCSRSKFNVNKILLTS